MLVSMHRSSVGGRSVVLGNSWEHCLTEDPSSQYLCCRWPLKSGSSGFPNFVGSETFEIPIDVSI